MMGTSIPRFSVLTAAYNRAALLPRCLDSILAQSFPSLEAIVVDDGSTDNTREVVSAYRQRDSRVRLVSQPNAGANAARNAAAAAARGEYVIVLDSDDEALPGWLQQLSDLIDESQAEVACCGADFVDEYGRSRQIVRPEEDRVGAPTGGVYQSGTYAVKRDVYHELGGFAEALPAHQSTDFRMRLFELCEARGYRIASISEVLVKAHGHSGPKIRSNPAAKLEATKYILAHHRHRFQFPQTIASWQAAAGGCAAELCDYRQAREFFLSAIRTRPSYWKNYLRWAATWLPLARSRIWNSGARSLNNSPNG